MRRLDRAHTVRLALPALLSGACLLALWVVLGRGIQAAPADGASTDVAVDLGPIASNGEYTSYLPFVTRGYALLVNGDFEDDLRGWHAGRGSFQGHGSGLSQSVVSFDAGRRALLGEAGNLPVETIPVGYGTLSQTFTLDARYVRLQYWVFSYDKAKGAQRYWDTFEVSINRPPNQIADAERNARGCDSTRLNPQGTLSVSGDGLVFCGGQPGTSIGTLWDSGGWKSVKLDLNAFQGGNITLYLTIWSREYVEPYYNDRAWFNTWTYVDNVQLTDN